jgi:HEAT repeat protein
MPDQPRRTVSIGPVTHIPVVSEDDPELAIWSAARKKAQALHSPDELLAGLDDQDWRVRHECIDRLIARARDDPRVLPALLHVATSDEAWQVRDAAVMRLTDFEPDSVADTLHAAAKDPHPEVRWSAAYALQQSGIE